MKIFRIVRAPYKDDLSGEGARIYGGRWNKEGDAAVYFSEHLSLSALEVMVHLDNQFIQNDFFFMEVEILDEHIQKLESPEKTIVGWNTITLTAASQQYGSDWLRSKTSLALSVPSIIIPQERNIIINPSHPDIDKLKVVQVTPFVIDPRVSY